MLRKTLIATAAVASLAAFGLTLPAVAAGMAKMYYVSQNAKTHKCSVTTTKPDGTKAMMIGTDGYPKKADATAAMKAAADCNAKM